MLTIVPLRLYYCNTFAVEAPPCKSSCHTAVVAMHFKFPARQHGWLARNKSKIEVSNPVLCIISMVKLRFDCNSNCVGVEQQDADAITTM